MKLGDSSDFGALIVIVALIAGFVWYANRTPSGDDTVQSKAAKDASWIALNENLIKSRLKDSGSANFRNAFVSRATGSPVVCGEVNAKNSFGGYAGYQKFIAAGKNLQFLESDMAPGEMDNAWAKICGR